MDDKEVIEQEVDNFEFDEDEVEELKKTIGLLKNQNDDLLKSKLPSNTDKYAIDFVKMLDEHDISYLTTKEVFNNYLEYRRRYTVNGEDLLSLRMLNAVVRLYFPKAKINHSNRHNKNTYFWVFEDE